MRLDEMSKDEELNLDFELNNKEYYYTCDSTCLVKRTIVPRRSKNFKYFRSDGTRLNDKIYNNGCNFSCNRAKVQLKQSGKYHFIKTDGNRINNKEYYDACNFSCNRAKVQPEKNGKWHYIDINGIKIK